MYFNHYERKELTLDDIRARAPSAFAVEPHSSRSERYAYVSTAEVLQSLYKEGFRAFQASQAVTRTEDKRNFTKHLIRLRHPNMHAINGVFPEIALLNSHDGTSAYKLKLGLFRLVCLNGCVTGQDFAGVSVYHKGDITGEVIEGAYSIVEQTPLLTDRVEELHSVSLTDREAEILAGQALTYHYGEVPPVEPWEVIQPRREADRAVSLWHRYQVIQENMLKGGIPYRNNASGRRNTTRPVRGIDGDLKLNKALWDLTSQMLALKNGSFDEAGSDWLD